MNALIRNYPRTFSSMLDTFFNDTVQNSKFNSFVPTADVSENTKAFEIDLTIPGMEKENISIDVNDKTLVITGEKKMTRDEKNDNFHLVENQYGSFKRSFLIPDNVDASKIEAEYKNGVLHLTLPKENVKKLETKISIK